MFDANDMETTNKFNTLLDQYNKVLFEEAAYANKNSSADIGAIMAVIDTKSVYEKLITSGTIFHDADGLHLNELGYDVMLEELVKVV
ncbi:MAG: hypothetical protein K9M11_02255 [Candidatus Pacebacteria bacterium]|nr:hypothetical protein [Candidatus Paceibacterota bacterium]